MNPSDLLEIHAIERLKYRYLRCLDQKRWDELEACFATDATASYGGGAYTFEGRDAIMGFLRASLGPTTMLTSHHCHHPEIELTGTDTATGVWALEDVVIETSARFTIRGAAFYEDRYVKRDGAWLITHTGYLRTYETIEPTPDAQRVTADLWATGGRSKLG